MNQYAIADGISDAVQAQIVGLMDGGLVRLVKEDNRLVVQRITITRRKVQGWDADDPGEQKVEWDLVERKVQRWEVAGEALTPIEAADVEWDDLPGDF